MARAGKTTLFDLISGFLMPDSGSVIFEGLNVTRRRPQRPASLGLARSFQDARLFGALTVHQTICVALDRPIRYWDPIPAMLYLPNVLLSERRLGKRADELIAMMGLDDYRDKFVSDLSTGSRRIVDLACQIGIDPKVILFDEPSSGIAQRETEALGPLLLPDRDITGASLLLIEHDMPLMSSVSDRIVACDLGRVVVEGDGEPCSSIPHVVASYLGSTPEVIERSAPEHHGSRRGGTSMTQADAHAPEFQAADRGPQEDLGWFRTLLRKYTNSFRSRAASLFWALLRRQKRVLQWFFFVQVIVRDRPAPGRQPHAGHGRQRNRQPDRAALGLRPLHHVLGPLGAGLLVHPAAARRQVRVPDRVRHARVAIRTSSRPSCAVSTGSRPASWSPARSLISSSCRTSCGR